MSPVRISPLFLELKHRRVFRVAGLYAVAAWAAIQVAATVFPVLELPPWTVKLVVVLAALGFPFALGLAWAFDLQHGHPPEPGHPSPGFATAPAPSRGRILRVPWLHPALAVLVVALVCGAGWAAWSGSGAGGAAHGTSPSVVAVLPFDVRAASAQDYWGDGMVSLLAVRLDGATGLRSVDPQALLRFSTTTGASRPERARKVASRFGAGLFVLGSVVGGSTRIQVAASLYETGKRGAPVATASTEGPADSVFALVDRIAIQLLSARAGAEAGTAGTAALTTGSLPALRAYLDGERAFREGRVGPAVEAFTQAVALDSTFALAYSRLSNAANWHGDDSVAVWASAAAERHGTRLPPRYRELLAADAAFLRGDSGVEGRLRQILSRYPQDAEVWYRLGEVFYHRNTVRGRSITEARGPFERALQLDPGNEMYVGHLRPLACLDGRLDELARLPPPPVPDSLNPVVTGPLADGTLLALAGPSPARDRTLQRLASVGDEAFIQVLESALECAPAETFAPLFALAERRREHPDGWRLMQSLERQRGRWSAAARTLLPERARRPAETAVWHAFMVFDPLRTPANDELRRAHAELLALDTEAAPADETALDVSMLRLHGLGMLAAMSGAPQEARSYAQALERLTRPWPSARAQVAMRAAQIRAVALARTGQPADALRVLDEFDARGLVQGGMVPGVVLEDNTRIRWLRAELLHAMERDREALAWYVTVTENWRPEYLAPALLRVAQIRERLGEPEAAARAYRRFLALWDVADPEVQPLVHDARRRLAALER